MKINKIYIPLLLGICLALGIMLGSILDFSGDQISFHSGTESKRKLNKLIDILNYEYVEQVDTDSVVDITVNHILGQLDPHSTYLSPEKVKQTEKQLQGNYVGIGISFYFENDSLTVIKALPGGPAYEAGIRGGDRIIRIDKQSLADKELSQDSILRLLEGKAGSKVELVIRRNNTKTEKKYKIKRNSVLLASIEATFKLTDRLGYIKLSKFTQNTAKEFKQALESLNPA
ncbi:MAG: PDZ domain-containing protein, partial [Flavobacteriaceae bacterium]|nr:PDZ domain-containing protein [Flavobacteriaceae bacterium]